MASRLTACLCLCESVTHTHVQNTYSNKRIKKNWIFLFFFAFVNLTKKKYRRKKEYIIILETFDIFCDCCVQTQQRKKNQQKLLNLFLLSVNFTKVFSSNLVSLQFRFYFISKTKWFEISSFYFNFF